MRKFFNQKLWRDNDVQSAEKMGSIVYLSKLTDEEYDGKLRQKLMEEAFEVVDSKSSEELISELSDLYEVIDALLQLHSIDRSTILIKQAQKKKERGSFEQRHFVNFVEHPIGGYGESYCLANPVKYPEIHN